jgi:HPt (histidine-containing phosphotransfer) domain-containing protein
MVQAAVRDDRSDTPAIDRVHLSRMTAGDVALERELLDLFDTQAALLLERMHGGDSATVSALAHTLKGSALGIGAGAVARAAGLLERAGADQDAALLRLTIAVQEAHLAIAALLARSSE